MMTWRWGRLAIVALMLGCMAAPASAQTAGVRVGISGDPDQFYFGGHVETAPVVDRLRFRPNVEIGLGDHVTLVTLNFEFAYMFPSQQPWNLYAGGGPALNIIHTDQDTSGEGGFNLLVGAAHRGSLFVEFKVGALKSPNVKFGVGYTWR